jgi:hypothetical protein
MAVRASDPSQPINSNSASPPPPPTHTHTAYIPLPVENWLNSTSFLIGYFFIATFPWVYLVLLVSECDGKILQPNSLKPLGSRMATTSHRRSWPFCRGSILSCSKKYSLRLEATPSSPSDLSGVTYRIIRDNVCSVSLSTLLKHYIH